MGMPNGAPRTEEHPMKAAVYYENGGPEVLRNEAVPCGTRRNPTSTSSPSRSGRTADMIFTALA